MMVLMLQLLVLAGELLGSHGRQQSTTVTGPTRLNARTVTCLPPNHTLALNQHWRPRPTPGHSRGATRTSSLGLSCARTEQWCYSGADILPAGKGNMTMATCCPLCHQTAGCVGVVLTTRPGNPGLTCYLKSAMERPGGGQCTSGTLGQPFPPPLPPPPPPAPAPPLPPVLSKPVQLQHSASGLCLEVRQPSGNVEVAECEPGGGGGEPGGGGSEDGVGRVSPAQLFLFHQDGTVTDGYGVCLSVDNAHGIDDNVAATNSSCDASACTPHPICARWTPVPTVTTAATTATDAEARALDETYRQHSEQGTSAAAQDSPLYAVAMSGGGGQAGEVCLDAGSGGTTSAGADVGFRPAALSVLPL